MLCITSRPGLANTTEIYPWWCLYSCKAITTPSKKCIKVWGGGGGSDPWIISAHSTADYFGSDRNDTLFSTNSPGTPKLDKEKSWLYTLDPILVTIIAMSSLGVLLGAICAGLLLYCTCSYAGLSSRSSTTLENYNFELYDGIKHKVKMNHQKCCSEA